MLQTAMASSGISVVMTRYSRSSIVFKTFREVRSCSKINTVFRDAPVRLEPDATVHAVDADNLFALSSPTALELESAVLFSMLSGKKLTAARRLRV